MRSTKVLTLRVTVAATCLVVTQALLAQPPRRGGPPPNGATENRQTGNSDQGNGSDRRTPGQFGLEPRSSQEKPGVSVNDPKAFQGYTLVASMGSTTTYLVDMGGKAVQTWESDLPLAASVYLLENGHLLRTAMARGGPGPRDSRPPRRDDGSAARDTASPQRDAGPPQRDARPSGPGGRPPGPDDGRRGPGRGPGGLGGGGAGGRVQEYTWDGELVWDYELATDKQLLHHDIERLPNGNVLMIVWESKTAEEAIAAGRNPRLQGDRHLQPDYIIEVKPTGKNTGEIVWEWHVWDHLIQDHDSSKANYGDVAAHPELVDINYTEGWAQQMSEKEMERLRSLGYLRGPRRGGGGPGGGSDWTHTNSVAYNAELDQIVLSIHAFHEIWVIDHSTTTEEAAGHTGGRSGKGGDLLYRWGNPRAYRAGTHADQQLFAQHDAQWIPRGLPGEGNILIFNNGRGRPGGNHSSVDEIVPPTVDKQGRYAREPGKAFGPERPMWSYDAPNKAEFFSSHISGAHRLPNGNTLICSGERATIFEVTPQKEIVWKHTSPGGRGRGGPGGFGGPPRGGGFGGIPRPGEILPSLLHDTLRLTADQRTQVGQLQKDVDAKLDKVLTSRQKDQGARLRPGFGADGFGSLPAPGRLMTSFLQAKLELSDRQKQQVESLQKEVDGKLGEVLTDSQREQLHAMGRGFGSGGFAGRDGAGRDTTGRDDRDRSRPRSPGGFQGGSFGFGVPGGFPGGGFGPGSPGGFPGGGFGPGGPGGFPGGGFGPPGRGPGGPGGPPGRGPGGPGGGQLFRAYRYGPDYAGLAGKDLTPGKTIKELQAEANEQREQDR